MPIVIVEDRAGVAETIRKALEKTGVRYRFASEEEVKGRARVHQNDVVRIGSTIVDARSFVTWQNGAPIVLPKKEFLLLRKLSASAGRVFTRKQLLDDVWGPSSHASDHTLDVHISRLRAAFASCDDFSIITIRGVGYKLVPHAKATEAAAMQ